MNKTESEFAQRLEIMKYNGEILRYEYEGITLRFSGVRYTPDFVVFDNLSGGDTTDKALACQEQKTLRQDGQRVVDQSPPAQKPSPVSEGWIRLRLIEVKGNFIKGKFERAVERFRHAKTYYGDVFEFELHRKTKDGWKRIY